LGERTRKSEATGRRGSPEVVEKRRAARAFNDLLLGRRPGAGDGRTERRRRRLLEELAAGKARGGGKDLTPIDVLSRVQALIELGESIASIRRACPAPPAVDPTPALIENVRRLHRAYGFPLEAYRFVGLGEALLRQAGIDREPLPDSPARRPALARTGPPAKAGPAKVRTRGGDTPRRTTGRGAA